MEKDKIILYQEDDRNISVDVMYSEETFWLTQKSMAELFDVDVSTINEHLKNIYKTEELEENSTIGKFPIVQKEGNRIVTRQVSFYNLDAIIAVGYRVNSKKATKFRQWATTNLREYIIKGFVLNDEMLKNGKPFGKDYFKELIERVRSIRASERRIWQQITDIFAEVAIDYDKKSKITRHFYAMVQNKFHYAITGKTAAEIISSSADHTKENMGLKTWKSAPDGRILKSDTQIAKNYLSEKEIKALERNISGYFDYIEDLLERENTFTMEEFVSSVNEFLEFRKYDVLPDNEKGKISSKTAKDKASKEYDIFNKTQKIDSDFDEFTKRLDKLN
ncbi:virulence RhuM family protein [Helcococcus kunzii]|uniref:virulence RhuM family protein n=1 Tax=Helcococcus kunzii TaxID=40091 RepID=UPI0021A86BA9|nr:virulence RhuM family protein [Helcococcus kunzii]MCT1796917.1 virulence RhuM family protein [Helcococcus kunzii]MCT1988525.1 virulence RhuM family protein [Helcococcus kunzii]